MPSVKKTLYTLCVNDYEPEITEITFPYMECYAKKIGADFHIITERKFPDAPVTYEKFQIYDLSLEHKNDWNIFVDADALIHPDFFDVTATVDKDTTVSYGTDFTPHRFKPNKYMQRDGRMIAKGNWLAFFSDLCRDYYRPLDVPLDEAIADIYPTAAEKNFGITPCHLIDDYTVTNNIARFGLKHMLIPDMKSPGLVENLFAHQYLMCTDKKIVYLQDIIKKWGIK